MWSTPPAVVYPTNGPPHQPWSTPSAVAYTKSGVHRRRGPHQHTILLIRESKMDIEAKEALLKELLAMIYLSLAFTVLPFFVLPFQVLAFAVLPFTVLSFTVPGKAVIARESLAWCNNAPAESTSPSPTGVPASSEAPYISISCFWCFLSCMKTLFPALASLLRSIPQSRPVPAMVCHQPVASTTRPNISYIQ